MHAAAPDGRCFCSLNDYVVVDDDDYDDDEKKLY
jgi:hypothetical protein